jgi:hypothetical protein
MSEQSEEYPVIIESTPCCEAFVSLAQGLQWFQYTHQPDMLNMPHVRDDKGTAWRVNYCPSCGKYMRDINLSRTTVYP